MKQILYSEELMMRKSNASDEILTPVFVDKKLNTKNCLESP